MPAGLTTVASLATGLSTTVHFSGLNSEPDPTTPVSMAGLEPNGGPPDRCCAVDRRIAKLPPKPDHLEPVKSILCLCCFPKPLHLRHLIDEIEHLMTQLLPADDGAAMRTRRRRVRIAWLAVLALLINALIPASFAAAADGQGREAISGWCGAAHGDQRLRNDAPPVHCRCCVLCATAAIGLEPPAVIGAVLPRLIAAPAGGYATLAEPVPRHAHRLGEPRGPPAQART